MKKKIVTALMTAALGTSLLFSQTTMAADNTAKTEDTAEADSTDAAKEEELKTIGEKPEEDKEGVLSVKLKNLTGKVITGVAVKNEKDEKYPDNFLKDEDKFETDEERVLWFDPNAKDEEKDAEAEKEVPKYNIQLTFEDETTAEIHTFPFGDTEEAELHLEGEVAYLVFDSTSQKKSFNTLETEQALAPKPTEAPAQTSSQSTQSYDNSSDYDYSYDYSNDSNDSYDYSNDYDYSYDNSDYDYDYSGSDDSDYSGSDDSGSGYDGSDDSGSGDGGSDDGGSDDGGSGDGGSDDGGNGCLDDGLLN